MGIYLSSYIRAIWLFPSLQINPSWTRPIELCMLLHVKDVFLPIEASRIESFEWYLAFIFFAIRLSIVFHKCHICFAKRALLMQKKSLKPNLPFSFGNLIFFHFIQWIHFSFALWPHQKLCIIESISRHNPLGSRKTLMQYVGIAWITAFNKISFPAWERNLIFQSWRCFHTQFVILLNAVIRDLPTRVGNPK